MRKKKLKANILVVDDERSLRESLHLLLKDDYHVHLAKTGQEALALIKSQPIDAVLLDLRMPEIDGLEILKLIKSHDSAIEVIMITAVDAVKKAVEAIRQGAYD